MAFSNRLICQISEFHQRRHRCATDEYRSLRSPSPKRVGRTFAKARRIRLCETAEMGEAELERNTRHILGAMESQRLAGKVETQVTRDLAWCSAAKPLEAFLQSPLADARELRQRGQ